MYKHHTPVLLTDVISELGVVHNGMYIDATLGAGGHTREILLKGGRVLALDADKNMITIATKSLEDLANSQNFKVVNANFSSIKRVAEEENFTSVDGILMDLGLSSVHFDGDTRGFSFAKGDQPLDMRLNPDIQGVTAADLLNTLREDQLFNLLNQFFEYKTAKRLVKKIVNKREEKKFATVNDLVEITDSPQKLFMALRIAVNTEYENLEKALPDAVELLRSGGILAVITFHSGEDRIVKRFMQKMTKDGEGKAKKAIEPLEGEIQNNPRARSAKLRIFKKR